MLLALVLTSCGTDGITVSTASPPAPPTTALTTTTSSTTSTPTSTSLPAGEEASATEDGGSTVDGAEAAPAGPVADDQGGPPPTIGAAVDRAGSTGSSRALTAATSGSTASGGSSAASGADVGLSTSPTTGTTVPTISLPTDAPPAEPVATTAPPTTAPPTTSPPTSSAAASRAPAPPAPPPPTTAPPPPPPPPPPPAPPPSATSPARVAWFYKPPPGIDAASLVRDYDVFVLTKNDEHFRDQLKAADPSVRVLQYVLSTEIEDPGGGSPQSNQVAWNAGDFAALLRDHPDWFLRNPDGGRQTKWFGSQHISYMDPAAPGWRNWFAQRLVAYNNAHGWDGVFLDNVELSLTKRQREGLVPAAHPNDQAWQNAMVGFLSHVRSVLGAHGKTVWGNGIEWSGGQAVLDRYAGQLDGMMAESFGTDWHGRPRLGSAWEKEIGRAERLTAVGDHSLLVAQGSRNDGNAFQYAYASYLLVAGPTVSFRYAHHSAYHQRWWYDAYDRALGNPTGSRYRQGVGWRRDFEHGSVVVDPQQGTSSITFG